MPQDPDGYFEITYQAPFKGPNVQLPENVIPKEFSPFTNNFIFKNGEIRTKPVLKKFIPGPPDKSIINAVYGFTDGNNVTHTVAVTATGLWQLNFNWQQFKGKAWNRVSSFPAGTGFSNLPSACAVFVNKFYFTNGGHDLWAWNGIDNLKFTPPSTIIPAFNSVAVIDVANKLTAGARFLGELNARLLLLDTIEQQNSTGKPTTEFTQRIRWCASGKPTVWDPTVDTGAGFNDFLEVPDNITNYMSIGRSGYVFRVNGITELTPISNGLLPFDFNHLWASERGIGNVFSYSIANYGPTGVFISTEDVYEISVGGFKNIGGEARDAIFADLAAATSGAIASIYPKFTNTYIYLCYDLSIPQGNSSVNWIFSFEDRSWTRWTFPGGIRTGNVRFNPIN